MTVHERPFGRALEDFVVGDVYRHWPGKTITEADDLVYSLVLGMSVPDVSGAAIANLEVETLQHKFPTFHGDTIHAETRVLDVQESKSKNDRGVVLVETKGFNQDGKEVCYFRRRVMVWKRSAMPNRARPYDGHDVWSD
jgi:acyl dehydratase